LKEREGVYSIYEEDLQLLPKQYYPVYKDEKDKQNFSDKIAQQVMEQIQELRQIFLEMYNKGVDFH